MYVAPDTHESDKKLWLEAHHYAPFYTLKPGEMLSDEDRNRAYEMIDRNEAAEHRDRMADKRR